jgi:glycosyltransferase involved in cell wall biosynthesis
MDGVSVLTSIYHRNSICEVERCFQSIIKQTYIPKELVVVYDGELSVNLYKKVNDYKSYLNINEVFIKSNMGLGFALHEGVKNCNYNYIARIDIDDVCEPDRFKLQKKYLDFNTNIDILGGQVTLFNDEGDFGKRTVPLKHVDLFRHSLLRNPLNHSTVMFRKSKILIAGNYPKVRYTQDYLLWVFCFSKDLKFANLPENLVKMYSDKNLVKRRGLRYLIYDIKPYIQNYKFNNNGFFFLIFALIIRFLYNSLNSIKFALSNINES